MFALGARKLVIPSTVVQAVQTSVIGVDVIASFRNIFGLSEVTGSRPEATLRGFTGAI